MTNNKGSHIDPTYFSSPNAFFKAIKHHFTAYYTENDSAASEEEIARFEENHSVKLSNELTLYFKVVNGCYHYEFLSQLNRVSELKKVAEYPWFLKNEQYQSPSYEKWFVLGDIMFNSHQWCILLNEKGHPEEIIEMDSEKVVAINIIEFLAKFIKNPYSLVL